MRHEALRLSPRHRRWFHGVFAGLFLSGAAWLALRWWVSRGDPDAAPHPAQPWLMKVHGAAAMLALIVLGTLIPLHLRRGWRAGRNRFTGAGMVAVSGVLVVTGYGLYYAGGEQLRAYTSYVHSAIGLALPLVVIWHIRRGRQAP